MRSDLSYLSILKLALIVILFECLGSYLGPSYWIWLRAHLSFNSEEMSLYNVAIEKNMNFSHIIEQEHLKDFLSEDHGQLIPVAVFSRFDNQLNYWGYAYQGNLEEDLIVLGQKGLLGRVGKRKGKLFEILPLDKKGLKIPVLSERSSQPLILSGNGTTLSAWDSSMTYQKNMLLYTLANDSHYPAQYPVARITDVKVSDGGHEIIARLLDDLSAYSYVRVYKGSRLTQEQS